MLDPGYVAALKLLHSEGWRPVGVLTSQGKDVILKTDEAVVVPPQRARDFLGLSCLPIINLVWDNAAKVVWITEAARDK